MQVAIWKKEVLYQLLLENETPWEFEIKGSVRSNHCLMPFLCIEKGIEQPISYFPNAIVRGKWVKEAIKYIENQGLKWDSSRSIESISEAWLRKNPYRRFISKIVLPPFFRWLDS